MLKYKLFTNTNEKSPFCGQVFAKAVVNEQIDLERISAEIQENTTAKEADVYAVLKELVNVMRKNLQDGKAVKIQGLGTFKLSIRGQYATSPKVFNPTHNIKGYRVNFLPEYTRDTDGKHITPLTLGVKARELEEYVKED